MGVFSVKCDPFVSNFAVNTIDSVTFVNQAVWIVGV